MYVHSHHLKHLDHLLKFFKTLKPTRSLQTYKFHEKLGLK